MAAAPTSRVIYPGIEILRAFAALLVLAYHVVEYGKWLAIPNTGIGYLMRHGWSGVDLFLTISGFVIATSALQDHPERDVAAFRSRFAIRRLARIVPLYFLTSAVFLLLVDPRLLHLSMRNLAIHVAAHALFLHNLYPGTHGSINGPTWSIGLEMQFYLAIFFLAPWLARVRPWKVLAGAIVVAVLWRWAVITVLPPGQAHPAVQFVYLTQLPGVADEFAFGIVLAMIAHRGLEPVAGWMRPGWRNFAGWTVACALLLFLAVRLDQHFIHWSEPAMMVAWRVLLAAGFATMIAAAITFPAAGHPVLGPLRYLGHISYGIYLWHMLVLQTLVERGANSSGGQLMVRTVLGTIALAALGWHLLEKPNLQKYKGRTKTQPAGREMEGAGQPIA